MRSVRIVLLQCLMLTVHFPDGSGRAWADPLTFYFEGSITEIHDYLDLDESVYWGAAFTGYYTFDPIGVFDYYPDNANVGLYPLGPAGRMSVEIGNYAFVTSDLSMLIWNDQLSGDLYEPISVTPFLAAGYQWSSMSIVLFDRLGMALGSDALPTGVPELSDFPTYTDLLIHLPGNDLGIRGRLTTLTPEPGSLALLAFGTMLLSRRRC